MNSSKYSQNRIRSIDALRAFTLIGILFIHTSQLFNYNNSHNDILFTNIDHNVIYLFIDKFLTYRFRIIFSLLFGVSFYLLSNNHYPKKKFMWRCMILTLIGIINKTFYTTDILFLYGICGIMMLPFLKLKINKILYLAIFLWSIKFIFYYYNIQICESRDFCVRYLIQQNFINVIQYPINYAIFDYITIIFPFGITDTLSYFFIGYIIADYGIIHKLDCLRISNGYGIILIITTIIASVFFHFTYDPFIKNVFHLLSAISYSYIFICLYNHVKEYFIKISILEQMGRLGLTNYTCIDLFGVLFVSSFVFKYELTFCYIFCFSLAVLVFLIIFSNIWLNYHKNGPIESAWRKLTNICFQYNNKKAL